MYSEQELQRSLTTKVFGRKLFVYESLDSTNRCAKAFASKGAEEGTVVIADIQTAGRGRFGRTWLAEPGSSILFSVVLRPAFCKEKIGLLSYFAAAGIALAVEPLTGIPFECKWPNDILINGRKFCGILMESTFQKNELDYIIIGIGINVNQMNFPGELEGKATSLRKECGREFDRKSLICTILSSLESLYGDVQKGDFNTVLREWKTRATLFRNQITLTQADARIDGIAVGLADDGGLILETKTGTRVFYAGDVSIGERQ
jgi:BirA family transcriptional regulator, biotin operon repressor / biotin---[acetyl-CoA-carboxylase] ligase